MNKLIESVLILAVIVCCKSPEDGKEKHPQNHEQHVDSREYYELAKSTARSTKVLVLFGGFPEQVPDIKREFKILDLANKNGLSVLYMNYNQKLWLDNNEKHKLAKNLKNIFIENELPTNALYLGGFSSGGNVSLFLTSFLIDHKEYQLNPKGIFIVDSPIDLAALYKSSKKNLKRNFSQASVQESKWLIDKLENELGDPSIDMSKYKKYSVYTSETDGIENIKNLKNIKVRLYTEPDTIWWQKNRQADYDQLNAYYIRKLAKSLKKSGFDHIQYIPTKNRGHRANGKRHPHSWSIVDKKDLIKWIME